MFKIAKFFNLSFTDQRLGTEALIWLFLARLAVLTLPFRWVASTLGKQDDGSKHQTELPKSVKPTVRRIGWIIRLFSRHTPWDSNCLAQAIACQRMLYRRRIMSTLYFGMAKDQEGALEAHAWLRSGKIVLTGNGDLDRHAIVKSFTK